MFSDSIKSESEVAQSCPTLWTWWTVAYQAPLSMGFSRQEYCSGLPFPSLGDLPNPRIKPGSPALQADALTSEPPGKPDSTKTCCLRKSLISTAGWSNAQLSLKRVKNFKYFLKKHIYSLHLCLYFCLANKFISIIFLDSSYKRYLSF